MSKYMDLVVVDTKSGKRIFRAPAWSRIVAGSAVAVDTRAGIRYGQVLDIKTIDAEDLEFYYNLTNATKPLRKVTGVVVDLVYDGEFEEDVVEEESEDGRDE